MATASAARSVHNTLTTTTVDVITITGLWPFLEILNRGDEDLFITVNSATPVADADDTIIVPSWSGIMLDAPNEAAVVRVLGNGNEYSITGYEGKTEPSRSGLNVPAAP